MNREYVGFWTWFFTGSGAGAGIWRLFSFWLIFDAIVAIMIPLYIPVGRDIMEVFTPVISLVVGLVITCVFGSVSIYSSINLFKMSERHLGGYFDFIYPYYMTILVSLGVTVFWVVLYVVTPFQTDDFLFRVKFLDKISWISIWQCLGVFLISFLVRTVWRTLLGVPMQVYFNLKIQTFDQNK